MRTHSRAAYTRITVILFVFLCSIVANLLAAISVPEGEKEIPVESERRRDQWRGREGRCRERKQKQGWSSPGYSDVMQKRRFGSVQFGL